MARDERTFVPWLERISGALAVLVPVGAAIARAAPSATWRDDLPLVRGLGLLGAAGTGAVSTLLVHLSSLVPLGPRPFRAALVGALSIALAAWGVYRLSLRVLVANVATPRLAPPLAAIAALTAALSPTWQREGTVAGGASVAAALGVAALLLYARPPSSDARRWLLLGALLGAATVESAPCGLALVAIGAARFALYRSSEGSALRPAGKAVGAPPPGLGPRAPNARLRRSLTFVVAAAASTMAVLLLPLAVRPRAPHAWIDLGRALGTIDLASADAPLPPATALAAWSSDVGPVALAIAAFGALIGLLRVRLRWLVAPLVLLFAVDAIFPVTTRGVLSSDPLAALHSLAIVAIAIAAAIGVQTAATMLLATRVPMAGAAAVLLVTFDLTLVAMTSEAASFAADRHAARGAEAWTDEALEKLPPRAAVLVRSRAVAWRLWAARLASGARPDVLVIPLPLLGKGRVASMLLSAEPAIAGLLRDVSIQGRPGENALSALADVRPLEVELDPSWDKRLVSHLVADRLWLRFAAEPLGASDRRQAFEAARAPFERVRAEATVDDRIDPATASVLASHLRDQTASAAALGDRAAAVAMLERLATVSSADPFIADLTQRLAGTKGAIDLTGLLR